MINKLPFYMDSFKVSTNNKYRYLVCDFHNTPTFEDPFAIAEIKIIGEGQKLMNGKITGTRGLSDNNLENIMDGDRVSYYQPDKSQGQQHVVFDFGKSCKIDKVEFYPRSDDNRIVSGELYEFSIGINNGFH